MTDRQCLRCGDPLQSSSAISNYCMPCQMRLASSIDTERAARLAAEARVKVLADALRLSWDFVRRVDVGAKVMQDNGNGTVRYTTREEALAKIEAALKEPANG